MAKTGYVHVYTGNGKGKTTAAMGLALRAAGAGLKVCIIQFVKGRRTSESLAFEKLKNVTFEQFGAFRFITGQPSVNDMARGARALREARFAVIDGGFDLVVLDESISAVNLQVITEIDLLDLVANRARKVELVLTGRNASAALIGMADLVTEMRDVKHYFVAGVKARKGIEM